MLLRVCVMMAVTLFVEKKVMLSVVLWLPTEGKFVREYAILAIRYVLSLPSTSKRWRYRNKNVCIMIIEALYHR